MNEQDPITIERCEHDRDHPYLTVSKTLTRDDSISFECRGLLCYLLSNIDSWRVNTNQVANHINKFMGRDKVRELFKEAIDAGYLKREDYLENGLKRYRYLISEYGRFKKCLPCTDFQGPGIQGPVNTSPLRNTIPNEQHKKSTTSSPTPSDPQTPELTKSPKIDDDTLLRKSFEKSLKGEEIERAIAYHKSNPDTLKKIKNPIGFVVSMIREGKDRVDEKRAQIVAKRKIWSLSCDYDSTGGYMRGCKTGVERCSGSTVTFFAFVESHAFWDDLGLGFD